MNKSKIIRDIVYGYIEVDVAELNIIDHPLFQRLLRIKQGASYPAYPSCNHTRFEHSLGVMYLGKIAIRKIIETTEDKLAKAFFEKYKQTVSFACLLHDIGHAPLSHLGEVFYQKDLLINELDSLTDYKFQGRWNGASPHELMSSLIVLKHNTLRKKLVKGLGKDFEEKILMIVRMICGIEIDGAPCWENALISILNSQIDVDKLDYLMRDNYMCGNTFFGLDYQRFVNSYCFAKGKLCIDYSALSTAMNFVYGRTLIYMWLGNHHKNVLVSGMMAEYLKWLKNHFESKGKDFIAKYFSYEGIVKRNVADDDIFVLFKSYLKDDTKLFRRHIFERGNLSPVWKTGLEFQKGNLSDVKRDDFRKRCGNEKEKGKVFGGVLGKSRDYLANSCGINTSDIMVFYCEDKYLSRSASGDRADIWIRTRENKAVMLRKIYNSDFLREEDDHKYPFIYTDRNNDSAKTKIRQYFEN